MTILAEPRIIATLLIAVGLGGCMTRDHSAADDAACNAYGLKFGTAEYANCRQNAANQRAANMRALAGAYFAAKANQQPIQHYMMPVTTPTTTNCMQIGAMFHCNTR